MTVTNTILQGLKDGECSESKRVQRRAVNRYFESQKRKHKLLLKSEEEQGMVKRNRRMITSRHRLFAMLERVEKGDDDLEQWQRLNVWAMSDEEEDENGQKIFRSLPWRNELSTDLIRRCDTALGVVRRYGEPSEREPNIHCLEFVNQNILNNDENIQPNA